MQVSRRSFLRTLFGSGLALMGMGGYAMGVEPGLLLRIQRYALTPPQWTPGLHLRVAVLTDLHAGPPHMPLSRIRHIVEVTNGLQPDLIVLLGDYAGTDRISATPLVWADVVPLFTALKAPLGVFAILGNHEWWDDWQAQRRRAGPTKAHRAFEAAGIPLLENRAQRLVQDGRPFWLLGLGDQLAYFRSDGYDGVDDLPGTLAQVTDDAPAILLAHEPDIFPEVPSRVALTLSGHTHGGQVRLFGYSPIVSSRWGNRYAYGVVHRAGRRMIVSGGLGCSKIPVRIGVPPELTVVKLT